MKRKLMYTNFSKGVYVLGLVTFINEVGNFLFPFLELFLTQKLGFTIAQTGFFIMFSMVVYVPGALVTSWLADRFSRKKIVIVTEIFYALIMISCGFFIHINPKMVPYLILVALLFDGATDPARNALHADYTTSENRQEVLSFFYLCMNIGFAIGPAIAGFLFNSYLDWLFFGTGLITLVATTIMFFAVSDKRPTKSMIKKSLKSNGADKAVSGNVFKALAARPLLVMYIVISAIFGFCNSLVTFGLPLYSVSLFGVQGASRYGILMTINAVVVIIFTTSIVRFSKKHRPLSMICIAVLLYALSYLFMGYTTSFALLIVLTIVFTLGEAFSATNRDYFVINHTPLGHRARFSSLFSIVQGSGYAIAPFIGGLLIHNLNYATLFTFSSILLFVCFALFLTLRYLYSLRARARQEIEDELPINKDEE